MKWRPISTAPRDGTDFLALIPFQRTPHKMVGCFSRDGKFRSWPGRSIYTPMFWMPLPEFSPDEPEFADAGDGALK